MALKKNETVTVIIEGITNLGFGVGHVGGEVIFVSDAVTGDMVEAKVIKSTPSYAVGKVIEYKVRSAVRTEDRCKNVACHSCAYKAIDYSYEKELKEETVRQAFKKCGLGDVKVLPLVGSPTERGYRNKAQYPVRLTKDGEYIIGFYAPKSHRVTEAAGCPLAPLEFGEILETIRVLLKKYEITVYDEERREGLLRHIYLRRGEVSGEILLTLVICGRALPHSEEIVGALTSRYPEICGILLNVNERDTNVILGDEFITLFGRDYIFDTLAGVKLKITAPSFYQVNRGAAELLYAKARELAEPKPDELILDLYCGAGSIGLSMAKDAGEIIGVEIVPSAVECAKFNAKENGIKNASFYVGDAANTEGLLARAEGERGEKILPDTVILDPPRGGCDEKLLEYVSRLSPKKIVYISCNPQTLARDVATLNKFGYFTDEVAPFDLFPLTGHVESVACLTQRLDN